MCSAITISGEFPYDEEYFRTLLEKEYSVKEKHVDSFIDMLVKSGRDAGILVAKRRSSW